MKALSLLLLGVAALRAQTPQALPDLPDDAVIAIFDDGAKLTMGQYRALYAVLPANQQAMVQNRKVFLEQYALMRKLAQMAEQEKLDKVSPGKDLLEYYRMFLLSQTELNHQAQTQNVSADEIAKYYAANRERYKKVKVKAIYISFTTAQASQVSNGKRALTEEEAKAKAMKLAADARAGADFVKLVYENSDDAASREKDGDWGTIKAAERDKFPAELAGAILNLRQGEIAGPVEQPNGFYVFRAEEVSYRPETEVQGEILAALQQEHLRQFMDRARDGAKVQFPNPAFLGELAPVAK